MGEGNVELILKFPFGKGKVRVTVETDPEAQPALFVEPVPQTAPSRLGGDGHKLLFVTNPDLLARKFGHERATRALEIIRGSGGIIAVGSGVDLLAAAKAELARDNAIEGVVLLGGVDIVLAASSTRSAELQDLPGLKGSFVSKNADRLQVWSDDAYADLDNDGAPEFPVSRIPDGGDPHPHLRRLPGPRPPVAEESRPQDVKRPFADLVYRHLDSNGRMYRSQSDIPGLPP